MKTLKNYQFILTLTTFLLTSTAIKIEVSYKNVTWKLDDGNHQGFVGQVIKKFEVKERGIEIRELKRDDPQNYPQPENYGDPSEFDSNGKQVFYFPNGLEKYFGGVLTFGMVHCQLREVKQADLKVFPNLTLLNLNFNNIEVLEKDLFKFNPKLKGFTIEINSIKYIDANIFDDLKQLELVILKGNDCTTAVAYTIQKVQRSIRNSIKNNCQKFGLFEETKKIKKTGTERGRYFWILVGCGVVVGIFVVSAVARVAYGNVKKV